MEKKILHLSNDFADQKIYVNLVRKLAKEGYKQVVYVPVRWKDKIDGNRDDSIKDVIYHYAFILKRSLLFKLRYHKKINIILKDVEKRIKIDEVGLIHAHFLFSDGGVAYELKKKYNIPYVVSVRASDIFNFFSIMLHLRKYGNEIMREAEHVIFINNSYKEIFVKKYLRNGFYEVLNKMLIIPNAIDDKWFEVPPIKKDINREVRLIYVGRIVKRKKLDVVLKALRELNKISKHIYSLDVVGSGEGKYMSEISKHVNNGVVFHGQINDLDELIEVYRKSHIFVMPSVKETFGLVYIEALSQGVPIIYCKNEGVSSFFEDGTIGVAVEPNNVMDVVEGILEIVDNYNDFQIKTLKASKRFNWNKVTRDFVNSYESIIK